MAKAHFFAGLLWMVSMTLSSEALAASPQEAPLSKAAAELAVTIKAHKIETVAVADFSNLAGEVNDLGRLLAEDLSVQLARLPELRVIDRSVISNMLRKNNLPYSELDSPEIQRRIGQETGVQAIIKGTMHSTESAVRLNLKVVDVASGQLFATVPTELPRTESVVKLETGSQKIPGNAVSATNVSPSEQGKAASPKTGDLIYHAEPVRFGEGRLFTNLLANLVAIQRAANGIVVKIKISNNAIGRSDAPVCLAVLKDTFLITDQGVEYPVGQVSGVPMMATAPDPRESMVRGPSPKAMKCIPKDAMTQVILVFPNSVPLIGPLSLSINMAISVQGRGVGHDNPVLQLIPEE